MYICHQSVRNQSNNALFCDCGAKRNRRKKEPKNATECNRHGFKPLFFQSWYRHRGASSQIAPSMP